MFEQLEPPALLLILLDTVAVLSAVVCVGAFILMICRPKSHHDVVPLVGSLAGLVFIVTASNMFWPRLRDRSRDVLLEVNLPENVVQIDQRHYYERRSVWDQEPMSGLPLKYAFWGFWRVSFDSPEARFAAVSHQTVKWPVSHWSESTSMIDDFVFDPVFGPLVKKFRRLTGFHRDHDGKVVLEWSEPYGPR